uniref:UL134 n=1 Tax=Human cytomegalovirus TaxID=10359 RepID=Q66M54_HCMV|nr:UL134 [Human betaherpesvirus 5]AAU09470.1 UL134 [Human betaherpesvirus 5]
MARTREASPVPPRSPTPSHSHTMIFSPAWNLKLRVGKGRCTDIYALDFWKRHFLARNVFIVQTLRKEMWAKSENSLSHRGRVTFRSDAAAVVVVEPRPRPPARQLVPLRPRRVASAAWRGETRRADRRASPSAATVVVNSPSVRTEVCPSVYPSVYLSPYLSSVWVPMSVLAAAVG